MPSIHKLDGHRAEKSAHLHTELCTRLNLIQINPHGSSKTKIDMIGVNNQNHEVRFSSKYAEGKGTQVWLTGHNSFFEQVSIMKNCQIPLVKWLGTKTTARLRHTEIDDFDTIIDCLNQSTADKSLLIPMILSSTNDEKKYVDYIVWINKDKKNKNNTGLTIVDANKYIDYIVNNCHWTFSSLRARDFGTFKLVDPNQNTLIHLQRHGSGTSKHNPHFHIYNHWPESAVIYSDKSFKIIL